MSELLSVEHWISSLAGEGFVINETAIDFLESLGGLTIRLPAAGISPYDHELRLDPLRAATGESDRAAIWGTEIGTTLFPVGEETASGNIIWIGSNGMYYYGREFGLYFLGESLRAAMDTLAFPSKDLVLLAN